MRFQKRNKGSLVVCILTLFLQLHCIEIEIHMQRQLSHPPSVDDLQENFEMMKNVAGKVLQKIHHDHDISLMRKSNDQIMDNSGLIENGTIEITEIKSGTSHTIPTIIVQRGNLKRMDSPALPFQMFQNIDNIFDALFDDLTNKIMRHEPMIIQKNNDDLETKPSLLDSNLDSSKEEHDEEHQVAMRYDSEQTKHDDDNILTAKQKKEQIKTKKRKNYFSKLCKYLFYSIVLFSVFILSHKLFKIFILKEKIITTSMEERNSVTSDAPAVELKESTKMD
jgi:hypothetical protein